MGSEYMGVVGDLDQDLDFRGTQWKVVLSRGNFCDRAAPPPGCSLSLV